MSGKEVIEQIKALPVEERAKVAKFIVEPDDFKEAMHEAKELEQAAKALRADYATDSELTMP